MDTSIVAVIASIAAICSSLITIAKLGKHPVDAITKKVESEQEARINEAAQRAVLLLKPTIDEVKEINLDQSRRIELLKNGQLDLLRQQILYLYNHHCTTQTLTKNEMEQLHKLYNDYVAEGGNSFFVDLYEKMRQWDIVDK